jgi:hypothetical protein
MKLLEKNSLHQSHLTATRIGERLSTCESLFHPTTHRASLGRRALDGSAPNRLFQVLFWQLEFLSFTKIVITRHGIGWHCRLKIA